MARLWTATKWTGFLGAVGGLAFASWHWGPSWYGQYRQWTRDPAVEAKQQAARFVAARRGDLRITVTEDGKLRAIKYHPVFPQLRGQSRITFLVPEGTQVKKGERLVEFEKKPLEDSLQQKAADLEAAKREVVVKEEALKIQVSTSKAAVKAAETKRNEAEVALKVYRDLEGPKKLSEFETQLNDAKTKLAAAQKTWEEARRRLEENLFTEEDQKKALQREVANAKEAVDSLRRSIETIEVTRKVFRRYDYPQNLESRKQAVENAVLEVEKAKVAADSEVHQKEAELAKVKDTIARLEREIVELKEQIGRCVLTAPADGMVMYGDPGAENAHWYNPEGRLRVGMDWYGSNTMMTIPDFSAFEVTLTIGEEFRGKLAEGVAATLSMEAIPGLSIGGTLKEISKLARGRNPWDQGSPKVFDAKVLPEKNDPRMIPGMSVRVELLAETVRDALLVPIEAVYNDEGRTVCYVRRAPDPAARPGEAPATEKRQVKVGKSNEHLVQILDGLKAGELVDVTPTRTASGPPAAATPEAPKAEEAKPAAAGTPAPAAAAAATSEG